MIIYEGANNLVSGAFLKWFSIDTLKAKVDSLEAEHSILNSQDKKSEKALSFDGTGIL